MNKICSVVCTIAIAAMAVGCSENKEMRLNDDNVVESRAVTQQVMSIEEANAMTAELQRTNAFIDVDFDAINAMHADMETPIEEIVKCKVAYYRLYSNIGIRNQRYYIKKSASELNLSDATYARCQSMIDHANAFISDRLADGQSFEEIMKNQPDFTNQAENEAVLKFKNSNNGN